MKQYTSYEEVLHFLYYECPNFSQRGAKAYSGKLEPILDFCTHLGQPQTAYPCIHVAGTNGKGSTCHFLASILQEHGLKVGLYTSPHLIEYGERIKINGIYIDPEFVIQFVNQNVAYILEHQLTFFEVTVALAFSYFKEEGVDIAVIEVGLGGRLDSTNIIQPLMSIITTIGLDHTDILGNTLEEIASEKAGILKAQSTALIGYIQPELKPFFKTYALNKGFAEPLFAEDLLPLPEQLEWNSNMLSFNFDYQSEHYSIQSPLLGGYQKENCCTVFLAIQLLNQIHHYNISKSTFLNGIQNVIQNTRFIGRFQVLQQHPLIIADVAHNQQGIEHLMQQLDFTQKGIHVLLGMLADKDLGLILEQLPKTIHLTLTQPNSKRAYSEEAMQTFVKHYQHQFKTLDYNPNPKEAFCFLKEQLLETDTLLVFGSFYLVGEILEVER